MKNMSFLNFLELLSLISINQDQIRVSSGAIIQVSEGDKVEFKPFKEVFPELTEDPPKAVEDFIAKAKQNRNKLRFCLSIHNGGYSAETFSHTKAALRIDIDTKLEKEQVFEYAKSLPITPNIISSTIKGWHIFYICSEEITREDRALIHLLDTFKYELRAKYSSFENSKIVESVHILYQIFTRYSEEIYLLRDFYTKQELIDQISALAVEDEIQFDGKRITVKTNTLPTSSLTPHTFKLITSSCPILEACENTWFDHTYHEWFLMGWKYAMKAHLSGDYKTYADEFVRRSKEYCNPKPDHQLYKTFEYIYKWVYDEKNRGYKYFSCSWLHNNTRFSDLCQTCRIAKWSEGSLVSSFIRDLLATHIPGFELDEETGKWCVRDENGNLDFVADYFLIEDYIYIDKPHQQLSLLKIATKKGVRFLPLKHTASANIDFSNISFIMFNPLKSKEFKNLFKTYLAKYMWIYERRDISFVGYFYNRDEQKWEINIAGFNNLKVEDINLFMYSLYDKEIKHYIPSTKGSFNLWADIYREIYRDKEPVTLLLIGFFLTHLLKPYLKGTKLEEELNPLVFLRGSSGTGKTTRLKVVAALFGYPAVIDISETTTTRIEREFGTYKMPLPLDEIRTTTEEKRKQVENLIYLIANTGAKATFHAVHEPIQVPAVLAGEPQNLQIEEMLSQNEGLFRRSLVVLLDEGNLRQYDKTLIKYNDFIRTLRNHHGFVWKFCYSLEKHKEEIRRFADGRFAKHKPLQEALMQKGFEDSKVKLLSSVDNLLNRIALALKVFGEFLGLSNEEISAAIESMYRFIIENTASFYEVYLPREKKLEEELFEFVVEFTDRLYKLQQDDRNLSTLKTIKGQSLEKLLQVAKMRTPSSQVLRLAKNVLFKKPKARRGFYLAKSVLVDRYITEREILADVERLKENVSKLPKEQADMCIRVYIRAASSVLSNNFFATTAKIIEKVLGVSAWEIVEEPEPPKQELDESVDRLFTQISITSAENSDGDDDGKGGGYSSDYFNLLDEVNGDATISESKPSVNGGTSNASSSSYKGKSSNDEPLNEFNTTILNKTGQILVKTQQAKVQPIVVNRLSEIPAKYNEVIYLDVETDTGTQKPVLMALYQKGFGNKAYLLDLRRTDLRQVKEWLLRFNTIGGWGLNYDLAVLGFTYEELKDKQIEDVQLLTKFAYFEKFKNKKGGFSLDAIIQDILEVDYAFDKKVMQKSFNLNGGFTEKQLLYNAYDVFYLPEIKEKALEKKALNVVYSLDCEALKVCVEASQLGIPFKQDLAKSRLSEIKTQLDEIRKALPFNPLSPQQTAKYLRLQSTKEEALRELILNGSSNKDVAEKVLLARKLSKEVATIDKYLKYGDRVKGLFWTTTAPSGRMSCNEENLQQVPRRLRDLFGFSDDDERRLIIADFPQIELRLAGALWQEPKFVEAFKEGIDLHKLTASIIYGKPLEEISKEERQIAKSANFGLIYGASPKGFRDYCMGNGIKLSEEEAKHIINNFIGFYVKIREKHETVKKHFMANPELIGETWLGREYLAGTPNEALNYQVQGSGAELFKRAITALKRKYPSLRIVNLVHDEIVVEADRDYEDIAQVVKQEMENAWEWCINQAKAKGKQIAEFGLTVEEAAALSNYSPSILPGHSPPKAKRN